MAASGGNVRARVRARAVTVGTVAGSCRRCAAISAARVRLACVLSPGAQAPQGGHEQQVAAAAHGRPPHTLQLARHNDVGPEIGERANFFSAAGTSAPPALPLRTADITAACAPDCHSHKENRATSRQPHPPSRACLWRALAAGATACWAHWPPAGRRPFKQHPARRCGQVRAAGATHCGSKGQLAGPGNSRAIGCPQAARSCPWWRPSRWTASSGRRSATCASGRRCGWRAAAAAAAGKRAPQQGSRAAAAACAAVASPLTHTHHCSAPALARSSTARPSGRAWQCSGPTSTSTRR